MDDPQETGVTVFLLPEIKMEEQDSVGLEAEDENASEEHRGSREEDPQRIKQEPVEEPSKNWDAQLEEFLRTLQPVCSEEETPQTSEVEQQRDPKTSEVPSQGETEPNKQASKLCVSPRTQPHLIEGTQVVFGAHLDADSYGKKREKALAGDAARLEMRRQHFRTLRYQEADGPRELCKQLQQQCRKWLNPDRNTKERMLELVTLEHFLAVVPAEMLSYLWENGPVTCAKAVALAEDFLQSQQRDRDLEEQGMQELSDTEERHETKQKDKASANLLEIGEWLKDRKEENPFLDRPEKMSAFLKTENDNNFLCQGEPEKSQQKTDGQNRNATEEKRDLYVDSHGGCKAGDESTIQQDVDMKYDRCKQGTQESSLELEKPYKCWHCGQSFSSSSDLLSHERNHVGEQLYRCSHCGGSERIHMGRRPHKCSHCGNTFGCNPQEETNGGKKFHTCAECGEKYMHRSGLLKHQGVHRGEKPYKCLKCGENFGNYSNFRTHCRTHTGEKQYKCLQCEMCFSSIARLRAHERIHVVVCSSCGKSFRNKSDLIEHERTHAREDSFVCFDCGKAFKFNSELMAHVRTHKDKKLECPDTKKTLICLECGDNFKHASAFKTHQRVHRGEHWKDQQDQEECVEGPSEVKMEAEEEEPRKRRRLTGEISKAAAVSEPEGAMMEESTSETKVTDEQPQPQCDQDSLKNDSEEQLMKAEAPQQQVPKKAVTFVSQKERNVVVQCKYCLPLIKKICSELSDASSVEQHLKMAHPDKLNTILEITRDGRPVPSEEPVHFDREEDDIADVYGPPAVRFRRSGKQNVTQKILDRILMDYITEEIVPLQTVDKPTFLALVRLGLPKDLTIMSAKTLRDRIEKRAAGLRESLVSRMSAVSHVATIADCWTDGKRTFLGVTAHWISPITLKREFGALTYKRLKGPLTYSVLTKALYDVHAQYGIHDKVVCVTTDNGSNFMEAFQGFGAREPAAAANSSSEEEEDNYDVNQDESGMEFLPLSETLDTGNLADEYAPESDPSLPPHHRCASYTLNLVATHDVAAMIAGSTQDGPFGPFQKHFCALARKCRKLWSKQNNSALVAEYIYEQCGTYLTVPNQIQWISVFDALKQLNMLLSTMPLKVDAVMDMCSLARITADERLVLQEYTEIMGPLALSLDILQRENGMFMGYLLPTLYSLERKLQELESKPVPYMYCLPLLTGIREALRKRFAGIWEDKELILAACLHPRFKTDWVDSAQTAQINRSTMEALLKAELKGATTEESSEKDQEGDTGLLDFFDIQPQEGRSVADPVEKEISKYLKTPSRELSSLLAFPIIWRSFLKFNTGVPSSAAAENLICRDGNIMAAKRHSLPDYIFEDLVLLKQNRALSTFQVSKHSLV
nr:PREDICTED: uncharacterized protein LOC100567772 isoform X2 [Anolis carolinensis]XP_016847342.1 PREDICTED: uncharacterized protein LOC100567772 isoform X2 [Anolis carolinensis]XP_016847343.1 PREDICTED: uncharacterized protein LOC100567772 isoform X2 [Anolis carolinensis]XP_016847345.1 PREDICTED: uncharacterized protein LOC100567772 isoform X2 [Anolis carolinensis]XP_016847346.1 PREDICTED: uncharacterized protein LOC100567772 isoform X2 [Anolis carolinensis]XP_016847347.1 PREDICTED: uncharact|eukprot:XP_016847341.1 PREDICTED: uncharacterized protein LOC100567772 isoform X2 [Anolis carolinensis]